MQGGCEVGRCLSGSQTEDTPWWRESPGSIRQVTMQRAPVGRK